MGGSLICNIADVSFATAPNLRRPAIAISIANPVSEYDTSDQMTAARISRLPDFIAVGPGRTGTTWLHRVLEGQVDLPYGVKETQFFNTFYAKGIDWYAHHFRYATGERKVAEICPYFIDLQARDRIKMHIPNCKIITTLRNPVDHSYSAYKLLRHYVWARGTFEEVLNTRPHLDRGNRYAFYLKGWFDKFGRENVLVTMYDELRSDPQSYLNRVCDFTGVSRIALAEKGEVSDDVNAYARAPRNRKLAQNARHVMWWLKGRQAYGVIDLLERAGVWQFCYGRGEAFPPLTAEQEKMLRERFRPEVEALEDLLKIDLSAWKKPRAARSEKEIAQPARELQPQPLSR